MSKISLAELSSVVPPPASDPAMREAQRPAPAQTSAPEAAQAVADAPVVREHRTAAETQKSETEHKSLSEKQSDALKMAFNDLNTVMDRFARSIRFAVFEQSGDLYAQVVDTKNNEVVKTIPSQDALEMMARLHEVIGMLVDQKG
jgi:flagellar protein FlaG